MAIVRRQWPSVVQFWFDEPIPTGSVDVAYFRQSSHAPAGSSFHDYRTLLIDLGNTEDQIQANFHKETRYEIRRAGTRDCLEPRHLSTPDESDIRDFHAFHSSFVKNMRLTPVDIEYLVAAANAGCLRLSAVQQQGQLLVWHSYIANDCRARLLHSASQIREADSRQRALISRANRYLHWQDMLYFKRQGVRIYDFGGLYQTKDDQGLLRVNPFKLSFGGTRVTEYDGVLACSTLGRIYLWGRSVRNRLASYQRIAARRMVGLPVRTR
jgi:hypothetical protein